MKHPSQTPVQGRNKRMWAALLVGVVLLLAMGATLIRIQSRPVEPRMAVLPKPAPTPVAHSSVAQLTPSDIPPAKAAAATAKDTSSMTGSAGPRPVVPRMSEPAVARPTAAAASAAPGSAAQ